MGKFAAFAFGALAGYVAGAFTVLSLAACDERKQASASRNEADSGCCVKSAAGSLCEKGKKIVKKIKGEDDELTPEELRARIEAARERIAAKQAELAQEREAEAAAG